MSYEQNNSGNNSVNDPAEFLPLSPVVFNILLALSDGEARHGYGISKEVERRTEGTVRLGPGTLYGGIKRMISQGLIVEEADDEREPEGSRSGSGGHEERRRYYRITGLRQRGGLSGGAAAGGAGADCPGQRAAARFRRWFRSYTRGGIRSE